MGEATLFSMKSVVSPNLISVSLEKEERTMPLHLNSMANTSVSPFCLSGYYGKDHARGSSAMTDAHPEKTQRRGTQKTREMAVLDIGAHRRCLSSAMKAGIAALPIFVTGRIHLPEYIWRCIRTKRMGSSI